MESQHTRQGQVVSPPDGPVGGVEVQVVDADPGTDDFLGADTTNGDGEYAVTVDLDDAGGASEDDPEIHLRFRRGEDTRHEEAMTLASRSSTEVDSVTVSVGSGSGTTSMRHHATVEHRGMSTVPRDPAHPGQGRFGRMFPPRNCPRTCSTCRSSRRPDRRSSGRWPPGTSSGGDGSVCRPGSRSPARWT
ncbi:hypothetical protein [Halorientalis pallida]|uniref:hypothetical protein n=1 Tax=Halorientalis pallida TaxID=2479928 RepID=UPI00187D67DF|nr:hypothetical protein [Halorientalis pallida]